VRSIIGIKFENYEVGIVRKMMGTAEGEVLRVGVPNGTVGEL
jgi:hypothetical protein